MSALLLFQVSMEDLPWSFKAPGSDGLYLAPFRDGETGPVKEQVLSLVWCSEKLPPRGKSRSLSPLSKMNYAVTAPTMGVLA